MNDCYFAKKDWRECKQEVSYNDLLYMMLEASRWMRVPATIALIAPQTAANQYNGEKLRPSELY